jgi:hypothetical protein
MVHSYNMPEKLSKHHDVLFHLGKAAVGFFFWKLAM